MLRMAAQGTQTAASAPFRLPARSILDHSGSDLSHDRFR
jgi:hypothetical protein